MAFERLRVRPTAAAVVLLVVSMLVAPLAWYSFDVVECWLPWSRATEGRFPWHVYGAGCNYPPVVPFLLAAVEGLRQAVGAAQEGPVAVLLIKLPGILSHVATVLLLYFGLRGHGEGRARLVALGYAASPALFVNAAVWGQYDSILCLAVASTFIALLNRRPVLAGALLGLALAIKLQAIIAVPAVAIVLLRTYGWQKLLIAVAAGAAMVAVAAAPHIVAGSGQGVKEAYLGATESWPYRSMSAYNGWFILDTLDTKVLKRPDEVRYDSRNIVPGVTYRQFGIGLFLLYVAGFCYRLWRLPGVRNAAVCSAACFFGFFMLSTQMHERYMLPALPLLALAFTTPGRWSRLFWILSALGTVNQIVVMYRHEAPGATGLWNATLQGITALTCVAYVLFFLWFSRVVWSDMALEAEVRR